MSELRIGVWGGGGRMGRALIRAASEANDIKIVGAFDRPEAEGLGKDVGLLAGIGPIGIPLRSGLSDEAFDVIIDFSSPQGTATLLENARKRKIPLVIGTTGLDAGLESAIREAGRELPIVLSPNMSVGVAVLLHLATQGARLLGADFDIEIVEMHHRFKADAPSGTALALAKALAEVRGLGNDALRTAREGRVGPRPREELGVFAVRGGDVVGEHTVLLMGFGERLELTHRAFDRMLFAWGALRAARWVVRQAPGCYGTRDVLGLGAQGNP
ncbi:MAG: 4-hydroxy-tetrahydrodipicolinate reductase [Sandaracinaceae bacterium]|nr:4-hydroxy-tetrahydrodipicolinate reductase [Sandaracinaceae bacterium]MDW8246790.1 4-hydroxy-tetrahydrodipicolinate reductase [Sandaracinaceae bacterium]